MNSNLIGSLLIALLALKANSSYRMGSENGKQMKDVETEKCKHLKSCTKLIVCSAQRINITSLDSSNKLVTRFLDTICVFLYQYMAPINMYEHELHEEKSRSSIESRGTESLLKCKRTVNN